MKKSLFLSFFLAVLLVPSAHASMEGILLLNDFHISSNGLGESGPVVIAGKQNDSGIQSLDVRVFGKHFQLNKTQLLAISALSINGIQLSYEAGYKELGGRTLYIVLSKGFTTDSVGKRFVVITESGEVDVKDHLP
jgi:hypothetical protein